jgi:hypothetical protein
MPYDLRFSRADCDRWCPPRTCGSRCRADRVALRSPASVPRSRTLVGVRFSETMDGSAGRRGTVDQASGEPWISLCRSHVPAISSQEGPVPRPLPVIVARLLDRDAALHPRVNDTQVVQGPAGGRGDPALDGLVEWATE